MNRGNTQGSGKKPGEPIPELIDRIVEDVMAAIAMPHDEWRKLWESPFVPMAIPTPDRRQYPCTRVGIDAAHAITEQVWLASAGYRARFTRAKFDRVSFEAIGRAIADCNSHLPTDGAPDQPLDDRFYEAIAGDYEANLVAGARNATEDLDRHIPCSLFRGDHSVAAFNVGPVKFRARNDWIAVFVEAPVLGHVLACEKGEVTRDELRKQIRDGSKDTGESEATAILEFLGSNGWVATVRIEGHEPNRSHEKAMAIVGLAIDAIGLRFPLDAARLFTKSGRQHLFQEVRLASRPSGGFLRGWSASRPGIGDRPGALAAKMLAEQAFLDAAGMLLTEYLASRNTGKAVHFVERWANALYWFGEARREASDFMGVVDYGCAADGISGAGGSVKPMIEFAVAALESPVAASATGGLSVADAVRRVYADGRNKIAHGEVSGLLEDHSETRMIGDNLVAALLNELTPIMAGLFAVKDKMLEVGEAHAYKALEARMKARA